MSQTLKITNLHVSVEEKPILNGVNLTIKRGETHALMGPNGSGKSTLGNAIMGHPSYEVTDGSIELIDESGNSTDVLELDASERSRAGLFMAFQRPMAVPGVKLADFLRHATTNVRNPERKEGEDLIPMREFRKELKDKMGQLRMDLDFARRYVNDGFSGGEMKRAEILQMAMLRPKFAILDETDSGLDVDAVKLASESIAEIIDADRGRCRDGHPHHHSPRQVAGSQHTRLHTCHPRRTHCRDRRRRASQRTLYRWLRPYPCRLSGSCQSQYRNGRRRSRNGLVLNIHLTDLVVKNRKHKA